MHAPGIVRLAVAIDVSCFIENLGYFENPGFHRGSVIGFLVGVADIEPTISAPIVPISFGNPLAVLKVNAAGVVGVGCECPFRARLRPTAIIPERLLFDTILILYTL